MAVMVFHKRNRMDETQLAMIAGLLDERIKVEAGHLGNGIGSLEGLQEWANLRALWKSIEADATDPASEPEPETPAEPTPSRSRRRGAQAETTE